jgi:hypothetical protein
MELEEPTIAALERELVLNAFAWLPKKEIPPSVIRTVAQYETEEPGTVGTALVVLAWMETVCRPVVVNPLSAAILQP